MMSVFDRLIQRLSPVGVYSETSPVLDAELTVYAEEIERLYSELGDIFNECFITTATSTGLTVYEELFGPERTDQDLAKRREMLQLRMNLGDGDFTPSGIKKALDSLGLDYTISEFPSLERLNIDALSDYSEAWQAFIEREVAKIVPAHLEFQLTFNTRTWAEHDSLDSTFADLDTLDLTWQEIDRLTS